LAVYDQYSNRSRLGAGVAIKSRQNQTIFQLGLSYSVGLGTRILEIGPGDGYIADTAAVSRLAYTAVEGSAAVAAGLRARGVEVEIGYVPPLPASLSGPFSCCYLLHVLEHMPSPQVAASLMDAVFQVLAPGGVFVIACPDYLRWGARFHDCDYTHSYPLTRRRLTQLLTDHGFEIVHHTVYCGPFFGYASLPVSWLAKLAYPAWVDGLLGRLVPGDVLNRGLLTFLPNLLTVARRAN
jgi:SAM-dependent methyltransferase